VLQPLSGDRAGKVVAVTQPAKLAAMEAHYETQAWAPVRFGPLELPGALSVLAFGDPAAVVTGLNDIARENWPPVPLVHLSFQVMVVIGTALAALGPWAAWLAWRGRLEQSRVFLWTLVLAMPLGFVALEAGWMVAELGRQPWIINGVMRTADAVTPAGRLDISLFVVTAIYIALALIVTVLMRRHVLLTGRDHHA
jgi:cytochrome d ubiquinol oxidase subunit I